MKAIVADLLVGCAICCLIPFAPAQANSLIQKTKIADKPVFLSAKKLQYNLFPSIPLDFNFKNSNLDFFISLDNQEYLNNIINPESLLFNDPSLTLDLAIVKQQNLALGKKPFSHQDKDTNLILGFHPTFWPNQTGKYWGLTTIEQWGKQKTNQAVQLQLNQHQNNNNLLLPEGISTLTISGGSKKNLVKKDNLLGDIEDFRGGVALHQGVSNDLTLGVGFVYDDFLLGFSEISFQPEDIPLKTKVSLMGRDQGLELHSHVIFQPAENFVLNFYSKDSEQKFDLNWGLISGVTLTAKGNSDKESLQAGLKFAFKTKYLAFAASAMLNNQERMEWQIDSKLGDLQLKHTNKPLKTSSELSYAFLSSHKNGFQCSFFVNYESRELKRSQEYLNVWGWRLNSGEKLDNKKYRWTFDLGYGSGSQGAGIIASVSKSLKPDVLLKLSYHEISVTSNEPKFKIEIGSK
ncbi:MAG: hypothetical protein AB4368_10365 [Xenococcaceae cyanobacterium]